MIDPLRSLMIVLFLVGLGVGVPGMAFAESDERGSVELVTHSSVVIEAGPQEIWPLIVDPSDWKQGGKMAPHSGGKDGLGSVYKALNPQDGSTMFYFENVEFVPQQRRTIKLYLPGRGNLLGYASWVLEPVDGGTKVSYHVYSETLLDEAQLAGASAQDLEDMERLGYESNKARFDRELEALKALVEGH